MSLSAVARQRPLIRRMRIGGDVHHHVTGHSFAIISVSTLGQDNIILQSEKGGIFVSSVRFVGT